MALGLVEGDGDLDVFGDQAERGDVDVEVAGDLVDDDEVTAIAVALADDGLAVADPEGCAGGGDDLATGVADAEDDGGDGDLCADLAAGADDDAAAIAVHGTKGEQTDDE